MFCVSYKVRTRSKRGTPLINLKITAFRNVNCNNFINYIIREFDTKLLERSSSVHRIYCICFRKVVCALRRVGGGGGCPRDNIYLQITHKHAKTGRCAGIAFLIRYKKLFTFCSYSYLPIDYTK